MGIRIGARVKVTVYPTRQLADRRDSGTDAFAVIQSAGPPGVQADWGRSGPEAWCGPAWLLVHADKGLPVRYWAALDESRTVYR
jgi:hypothetical protein